MQDQVWQVCSHSILLFFCQSPLYSTPGSKVFSLMSNRNFKLPGVPHVPKGHFFPQRQTATNLPVADFCKMQPWLGSITVTINLCRVSCHSLDDAKQERRELIFYCHCTLEPAQWMWEDLGTPLAAQVWWCGEPALRSFGHPPHMFRW